MLGACDRCPEPAPDGHLCQGCLVALAVELGDVAGRLPDNRGRGWRVSLPDELTTTLIKDDQLGDPNGEPVNGGSGVPLVFKAHAGEALWVLHNTLQAWAWDFGLSPWSLSPRELASWFGNHLELLGRHPDAGQLADEITEAVHQARRAIDRPEDDRIYLGPCGANTIDPYWGHRPCREELYAGDWQTTVHCPRCDSRYDVEQRHAWLRDQGKKYQGTAAEVAGFLRLTGVECTTDQVRAYARSRHGRPPRIEPVGYNGRGRPLFLISDVLAAVKDRYVRRTPGR